jgi:hypothetical protein
MKEIITPSPATPAAITPRSNIKKFLTSPSISSKRAPLYFYPTRLHKSVYSESAHKESANNAVTIVAPATYEIVIEFNFYSERPVNSRTITKLATNPSMRAEYMGYLMRQYYPCKEHRNSDLYNTEQHRLKMHLLRDLRCTATDKLEFISAVLYYNI